MRWIILAVTAALLSLALPASAQAPVTASVTATLEPMTDISPQAPPVGVELPIYQTWGGLLLQGEKLRTVRIHGDSMQPVMRTGHRAVMIENPSWSSIMPGSIIVLDGTGCALLPQGLIIHQVVRTEGMENTWKAWTRGSMRPTDAVGVCPVTTASLKGLVIAVVYS